MPSGVMDSLKMRGEGWYHRRIKHPFADTRVRFRASAKGEEDQRNSELSPEQDRRVRGLCASRIRSRALRLGADPTCPVDNAFHERAFCRAPAREDIVFAESG